MAILERTGTDEVLARDPRVKPIPSARHPGESGTSLFLALSVAAAPHATIHSKHDSCHGWSLAGIRHHHSVGRRSDDLICPQPWGRNEPIGNMDKICRLFRRIIQGRPGDESDETNPMAIWAGSTGCKSASGCRLNKPGDGTNPNSRFPARTLEMGARSDRPGGSTLSSSPPGRTDRAAASLGPSSEPGRESRHAQTPAARGRSTSCTQHRRQLPFPVEGGVLVHVMAAVLPIWHLPRSRQGREEECRCVPVIADGGRRVGETRRRKPRQTVRLRRASCGSSRATMGLDDRPVVGRYAHCVSRWIESTG